MRIILWRDYMHIHVNGRNIEITDAIKAYAKEKLSKVASHYDQIEAIDIVLTVNKNPSVAENHKAEVICKLTTDSIKVEEDAESMYASIDLVTDKLNRQVQKFKDKHLRSKNKNTSIRMESSKHDVDADDAEEVVVE